MSRWSRQSKLGSYEKFVLRNLCEKTPGMVRYGNKARVTVNLPVELAQKIALLSKSQDKSISEVIIRMLQEK